MDRRDLEPGHGLLDRLARVRALLPMTLAGTRLRNHPSRRGLTVPSKSGPVWTGEVRLNEAWLTEPLHWRRPRMIFVCAHGDLFHEDVPDQWLDRVFAVMALAPQHTFQLLTKRAERMHRYVRQCMSAEGRPLVGVPVGERMLAAKPGICYSADYGSPFVPKPLPNVWLGVSAERQNEADERIPHLLKTPAAVRFVSAEPLLASVDLTKLRHAGCSGWIDSLSQREHHGPSVFEADRPALDWVIVGGESGPDARPMHPDWARSLRDHCAQAGVPFFFKQWGEFFPADQMARGNAGGDEAVRRINLGSALRDGNAVALNG